MTLRRTIVASAIAVPLVAGVGAFAWLQWLPNLVRARAQKTIEARTGLAATVAQVRVGWSSVELLGLRVGEAAGTTALFAELDRVVVSVSPWDALREGVGGWREIRAGQLSVQVHRDHHGFAALWEQLRPASSTAGPKPTAVPSQDRHASIEGVSVHVRDQHGLLVAARTEQLSLSSDALSLQVREAQLGEAPGAQVSLKDVEINADRVEGDLILREMHVGQANVTLGAEDAPSLRARVRRLWPSAAGVDTTADQDAAEQGSPLRPLLRRLTDGSVIVLERASVMSEQRHVLRDLKARLQATGSDALLLEGSGHTTADGVVEWKLRVQPEAWQGEGNVDLEGVPLSLLAPLLPELPWHDIHGTRVDAQLLLRGDGPDRLGWSGRVSLIEAALYSPKLAPEAVVFGTLGLEGRGHVLSAQHRIEVTEGRVLVGDVSAAIVGAAEWTRDHYLFDLSMELPRTACEDVLHMIPRGLLSDVADFHLAGVIGGRLKLKVDSRALADTVLELGVEDRCDFVEIPEMADLRRFTGAFTHVVVEPDETLFEMETGPGTAQWAPIEAISPLFVHAVLAHEDTQFFSHHGFSPAHIRGALVRNLEAGRYVLGASTISMQLVKNVLLRREKTLARKAQEVVLTWFVERMLDKRDIIELYLNVIEYGPGVYGIRNAAHYYFSREPSELSPAEAVFLSTILPNPKAYHAFFEDNALSASWIERMRSQLQRMQARGWYAPETAQYGLQELSAFKFYPEGSVRTPSATPMPTKTSPLPYQAGVVLSNGLPSLDQFNFATIDGGD